MSPAKSYLILGHKCQSHLMIGNLKSEIEKKEGNIFTDFHIVDNSRCVINIC